VFDIEKSMNSINILRVDFMYFPILVAIY